MSLSKSVRKEMPSCRVCSVEQSKYTCPRCEAPYCSLACYKNHSNDCIESFYQSQVEHELSHTRATEEDKQKLEQIMQRLKKIDRDEDENDDAEEEQETEEESNEREKYERLQLLSEKDDICVEDLTEEEKMLFEKFVQLQIDNEGVNLDMKVWEPWWDSAVIDMDGVEDENRVENVPHLCREASPLVANSVFQVVFAYCHMARTYNGDWDWDHGVATKHILNFAKSATKDVRYESCNELYMELCEASYKMNQDNEFSLVCLEDSATLLSSSADHLAKAFSDILKLLNACTDKIEDKHKNKYLKCVKKVEFFRSYAVHFWGQMRPLAVYAKSYSKSIRDARKEGEDKKNAADQQRKAGPGGVILPGGLEIPS